MGLKKKIGLTLIELVMTISIVGILAGGSMIYIKQVIDLWNFISFRSEIVSPGRMALARMSREIRQVQNSTSVLYANSTRVRFTDVNNADIDYYLSNSSIMRNADILAGGVRGFRLSYYNRTNSEISSPQVSPANTDIKRIMIRVEMFSGDQNKTFQTQVWPRNLGG